jgi:hypothetical protein
MSNSGILHAVAQGYHNAGREPQAARGGFWRGLPLAEGAAPNRQQILYFSDMHFRINKL